MMMTPTVLRTAFRGLALGGVVMLGACNGVGEGIAPVSAVLLPAGGAEGDASLKAYTCLNTALTLIVDFSNGARGDFTSRAKWSSNKPDVVTVSDGDVSVPDQADFFFGKGVLIPKKAGTALITAQYLDFKNTITVTVDDPTNFKITPAEANLAIGSALDLSFTADLDGVSRNVDGSASWAFVESDEATDPIVTIGATTGSLLAKGTTNTDTKTVTARVRIPGCGLAGSTVDAMVSISPLSSLTLSKEFDSDNLVAGTTERFTATGTLADGKTQDLSGQVSFRAYQPGIDNPDTTDVDESKLASKVVTFLIGSLRNLALASAPTAAESAANLSASYSYTIPDDDSTTTDPTSTPVVSNVLPIKPVAATLLDVTVPRNAAELAPGNSLQLKAVGKYQTTAEPVTAFDQDITRHVNWKPSLSTDTGIDSLVVQTSSGLAVNALAGLVVANSKAETGKIVEVTATNDAATGVKTAKSAITIDPTEPQETP